MYLDDEGIAAWVEYMWANAKAARQYREIPIAYFIAAEDKP